MVDLGKLKKDIKAKQEEIKERSDFVDSLEEKTGAMELPELAKTLPAIKDTLDEFLLIEDKVLLIVADLESLTKKIEEGIDSKLYKELIKRLTFLHTAYNLQVRRLKEIGAKQMRNANKLYVNANVYKRYLKANIGSIDHMVKQEKEMMQEFEDAIKKLSKKLKIEAKGKAIEHQQVLEKEAEAAKDAYEAKRLVDELASKIGSQRFQGIREELDKAQERMKDIMLILELFRETMEEKGYGKKEAIKALAMCRTLRDKAEIYLKELKHTRDKAVEGLNDLVRLVEGTVKYMDNAQKTVMDAEDKLLKVYDIMQQQIDKAREQAKSKSGKLAKAKRFMSEEQIHQAALEHTDLKESIRQMEDLKARISHEKIQMQSEMKKILTMRM